MRKWCCRICGHDEYAETFDKNYLCMGCSIVFASPSKFNLSTIKFKKLHEDAILPTKGTDASVGHDLYALEDCLVTNRSTAFIPTGLSVELPPNVEMQIRMRSGLGKKGLMLPNGVGTIDPDYRGQIMMMMVNAYDIPFQIKKGDRVAQGLFTTKLPYELEEVFEISETDRGAGGFGSTGTK